MWATRGLLADAEYRGTALVEADEDKIVYKKLFNLPDTRLPLPNAELHVPLGNDRDDTAAAAVMHNNKEDLPHYPLQVCRSVVGNQPYKTYVPRTTFLQLGAIGAHRSVLKGSHIT